MNKEELIKYKAEKSLKDYGFNIDGDLKLNNLKAEKQRFLGYHIPKTKVGRNEPCPCGSGKKYKKCCGA